MRISDWSSDVCSSDLVEGEVFVLERFGQVFGGVVDGVEGEIVAPLRGGYVGQHRVEAGEELRLRQREAVACRHVEGLEERGPVHERRALAGLFGGHEVVDRKSTRLNSSHS